LRPGEPPRLEISWAQWGRSWKNLTVRLDGVELGTLRTEKEIKAGTAYTLPDGSTLEVRQTQSLLSIDLHLLLDGRPVPGSDLDPGTQVRRAAHCVFAIAGLSIAFGLLAEGLHSRQMQAAGMGYASVGFGVIFLILGYFAYRGSFAALLSAFILFALDTGSSVIFAVMQPGRPVGGVVLRIYFFAMMIRGLRAMRAANQPEVRSDVLAGV
jgi:hypothetical protein